MSYNYTIALDQGEPLVPPKEIKDMLAQPQPQPIPQPQFQQQPAPLPVNSPAPSPPPAPAPMPLDRTPTEKPVGPPVLGWLICVRGTRAGQDIPLFSVVTQVGENLNINPDTIGCTDRKLHIIITYDMAGNTFSIRNSSECKAALNGAPLLGQFQALKASDLLQLPGVDLTFAPFCEGERRWD